MHIQDKQFEGTLLRYGAYIFGFSDVLFDTRKAYESGYIKAFESLDGTYNVSDYRVYRDSDMHALFDSQFPQCPCKYREFVAEFFKGFNEEIIRSSRPYSDTLDGIRKLAELGLRLGIVSGLPEMYIREILEKHDIGGSFKSVVGFERSPVRKPDPYQLNLCLQELGSEASDCVHIGSGPDDALASERAGIGKVLIDREGDSLLSVADLVMYDLTSLPF